MEKVYAAKDNIASLGASELLSMLKDSFIFLGNANVGMVTVSLGNVKAPYRSTCKASAVIQWSSRVLIFLAIL